MIVPFHYRGSPDGEPYWLELNLGDNRQVTWSPDGLHLKFTVLDALGRSSTFTVRESDPSLDRLRHFAGDQAVKVLGICMLGRPHRQLRRRRLGKIESLDYEGSYVIHELEGSYSPGRGFGPITRLPAITELKRNWKAFLASNYVPESSARPADDFLLHDLGEVMA